MRLTLILFCLLGIGLFAHSQGKKTNSKVTIVNGADAIPVTVISHKKSHRQIPVPPKPPLDKEAKPLPPPKPMATKFTPPVIIKDGEKPPPPPPPPAKPRKTKPSAPDAPPPPPEKAAL